MAKSYRRKMRKSRSRKNFAKGTRVNKRNQPRIMRGGIRF